MATSVYARWWRIVAKTPAELLLADRFPWLTRYENLCASCFAATPVPVPSPMPVPIPAPTPAPTTRPPTPLESWLLGGCYDVGGVRAGAARLHGRDERADGDLCARVGVWLLKSKFRYLHYENRQRRACFNATETAPPSPNRGHLAKGGSWVLWGSWGCFGVLQFRPERASGVWLLKSKFSLSALRKLSAARLLQRYRNRISGSQTAPPSPNRGHLAKEGPWVPWGSWGCFGVLRFRPERASGVWLLKSKFRYLHYKFRNRPKCASTPQKPNFRLSNRPFGWPG